MSESERTQWAQLLGFVARLFVGGLFVYAGWPKALDPHAFAIDIANYRLLPASVLPFVAVTLPWIELVCGLGLIVGFRIRANALVATGMLLVFLYGAVHAIRNGINIDCGCFGSTTSDPKNPIDGYTVLRDLAFIAASMSAMLLPLSRLSVDTWLARRREPAPLTDAS